MRRLTKKQKGFVKDYVRTGIGSLAVKENYNVANDETARVMASQNLTKPNVQKAIADMLPDDLLAERHLELLNKREVYKMIGNRGMIIDQPDTQAVSKGLEMAYKIKGTYAPEKSVQVNVNVEPSDKISALAKQLLVLQWENEEGNKDDSRTTAESQ